MPDTIVVETSAPVPIAVEVTRAETIILVQVGEGAVSLPRHSWNPGTGSNSYTPGGW